MALYKKSIAKSHRNWGPNSVFAGLYSVAGIDENYVEQYTERVMDAQNHQLDPLKQDLADWINNTIGIAYLSGENFLHELDNGAVLCHLAQVIRARAKIAILAGLTNRPLPKMRDKYFENAMRRSFFSRDNMENFIKFCRSIGVHENLLFESDDLVLHNQPRNVILCLLEVARIVTDYGIEPPNLIQLEREMTEERTSAFDCEVGSQICWQFQSLPSRFECETLRHSSPPILLGPATYKKWSANQLIPYRSRGVNTDETGICSLPQLTSTEVSVETEQSSRNSKDDSFTYFETKMINESDKAFDELDRKVEHAAQLLHSNCRCANRRYLKLKIRKIGEGKYTIAGRNVFVRFLKSRHMMVRVGGGWDTLDHFLQRHDPCQVKASRNIGEKSPTLRSILKVPSESSGYYSR